VEQASQLASFSSQTEKKWGDRVGENQRCPPGFPAVSARRAALFGRIVRSSRAGAGGGRSELIRVGGIVQRRLHTGAGRQRGVEVEKKRTPEKATEE